MRVSVKSRGRRSQRSLAKDKIEVESEQPQCGAGRGRQRSARVASKTAPEARQSVPSTELLSQNADGKSACAEAGGSESNLCNDPDIDV